MKLSKRVIISLYTLTGQSARGVRRLGTRFFLPEAFVLRFAHMAKIEPAELARQLDGLASFDDDTWCGHWNELAAGSEAEADRLVGLGSTGLAQESLTTAVAAFAAGAFPGTTPGRIEAYRNSRRVFARLLELFDERWDATSIGTGDASVDGYLWTPPDGHTHPLVIVVSGLEGTAQELVLLLRRHLDSGLAFFVMEMPGTFASPLAMSGDSSRIFESVLEHFAADPAVDAGRIALLGVSFGGYWAARMAATSHRLACAVADGAPTNHTFRAMRSLGTSQIVLDALMHVTATHSLLSLRRALRDLSLGRRDLYRQIEIPLLVINGDSDSLCSSEDSVELATQAPRGLLKLYADDDHCAIRHLDDSAGLALGWLSGQLRADPGDHGARATSNAVANR